MSLHSEWTDQQAIEAFESLRDSKTASGLNKAQAVVAIQRSNPSLHNRYLIALQRKPSQREIIARAI